MRGNDDDYRDKRENNDKEYEGDGYDQGEFEDIEINCKDCGAAFTWTTG